MRHIAAALTALSVIFVAGSVFAAADEAKGKRVFNKCRACHSVAVGVSKIGPSLNSIIGRTAGSWKKKNGKLRLIFESRAMNCHLNDPTKTRLPRATAL